MNYLPEPAAFQRDIYQVRVALFQIGSLEKETDQAKLAIAEAGAEA